MQTVTAPPRYVNVPSALLYRDDLDPRLLRTFLRIYGMHWDPEVKPRLKAKDWQTVAGVPKTTFYRHIKKLASSGWLLFSQDGKGVLSFEFSDHTFHEWDSSSMDGTVAIKYSNPSSISIQEEGKDLNAAVPPAEKKAKKERDPNLDNSAVVLYSEIMHLTPNHFQRDLIVKKVKDLDNWKETLAHWAGHGWRPTNVKGMLDSYQLGGSEVCSLCKRARKQYAEARRKSLPEDLHTEIAKARLERGLSEEDVYG